jgi:hypothetical protein
MSLDELARSATAQLSRSMTDTLDPGDMLRRLHGSRRRRTGAVVAAVAVAVLATVLGSALVTAQAGRGDLPAHRGSEVRSGGLPAFCHDPLLRCLGDRRLRILLRHPFTVTVPGTFRLEPQVPGKRAAELYRSDVEQTGVTLMQDVVPVRDDDSWTRDPAAGTTARSMARWLRHRPYFQVARLTSRQVAGRTAWLVTGRVRADAFLSESRRAGFPVAPAFRTGDVTSGVAPLLPGTFTLVDQPRGGVTVIWSWTVGADRTALPGNRPMVTALLR